MTTRRAASTLGALVALLGTTHAAAYRPFDGTDADVAEPREVELELGPLGYERHGPTHSLVAPAVVLNYGVAPGFEAVLEGRQQWVLGSEHRSELEDVALSLKSLLRQGSLQDARGVSVALETGLLLPGSERRLGAHVASIFSWRWPALVLHLNIGNDLLTSVHYAATTSLIVEGPSTWSVRPVAELWLERDFGAPSLAEGLAASALVGAVASWSPAWSFDLALRYGRVEGEPLQEVRLGFTWAFEAW